MKKQNAFETYICKDKIKPCWKTTTKIHTISIALQKISKTDL